MNLRFVFFCILSLFFVTAPSLAQSAKAEVLKPDFTVSPSVQGDYIAENVVDIVLNGHKVNVAKGTKFTIREGKIINVEGSLTSPEPLKGVHVKEGVLNGIRITNSFITEATSERVEGKTTTAPPFNVAGHTFAPETEFALDLKTNQVQIKPPENGGLFSLSGKTGSVPVFAKGGTIEFDPSSGVLKASSAEVREQTGLKRAISGTFLVSGDRIVVAPGDSIIDLTNPEKPRQVSALEAQVSVFHNKNSFEKSGGNKVLLSSEAVQSVGKVKLVFGKEFKDYIIEGREASTLVTVKDFSSHFNAQIENGEATTTQRFEFSKDGKKIVKDLVTEFKKQGGELHAIINVKTMGELTELVRQGFEMETKDVIGQYGTTGMLHPIDSIKDGLEINNGKAVALGSGQAQKIIGVKPDILGKLSSLQAISQDQSLSTEKRAEAQLEYAKLLNSHISSQARGIISEIEALNAEQKQLEAKRDLMYQSQSQSGLNQGLLGFPEVKDINDRIKAINEHKEAIIKAYIPQFEAAQKEASLAGTLDPNWLGKSSNAVGAIGSVKSLMELDLYSAAGLYDRVLEISKNIQAEQARRLPSQRDMELVTEVRRYEALSYGMGGNVEKEREALHGFLRVGQNNPDFQQIKDFTTKFDERYYTAFLSAIQEQQIHLQNQVDDRLSYWKLRNPITAVQAIRDQSFGGLLEKDYETVGGAQRQLISAQYGMLLLRHAASEGYTMDDLGDPHIFSKIFNLNSQTEEGHKDNPRFKAAIENARTYMQNPSAYVDTSLLSSTWSDIGKELFNVETFVGMGIASRARALATAGEVGVAGTRLGQLENSISNAYLLGGEALRQGGLPLQLGVGLSAGYALQRLGLGHEPSAFAVGAFLPMVGGLQVVEDKWLNSLRASLTREIGEDSAGQIVNAAVRKLVQKGASPAEFRMELYSIMNDKKLEAGKVFNAFREASREIDPKLIESDPGLVNAILESTSAEAIGPALRQIARYQSAPVFQKWRTILGRLEQFEMPRGGLQTLFRGRGKEKKWFDTTSEILDIQRGFNDPALRKTYNAHGLDRDKDLSGLIAFDAIQLNKLAGTGGRGSFRYIFNKNGRIVMIAEHRNKKTYEILHRF